MEVRRNSEDGEAAGRGSRQAGKKSAVCRGKNLMTGAGALLRQSALCAEARKR